MAGEEDVNSVYLTKCMDFCQLFGDGQKKFFFNVAIGDNFALRVTHSGVLVNTSDKNTKKNKKKYVSPSTRRRNNLRLLAFKARRAANGGCSSTQPGAPPP